MPNEDIQRHCRRNQFKRVPLVPARHNFVVFGLIWMRAMSCRLSHCDIRHRQLDLLSMRERHFYIAGWRIHVRSLPSRLGRGLDQFDRLHHVRSWLCKLWRGVRRLRPRLYQLFSRRIKLHKLQPRLLFQRIC
jgi:hypothetical protein